MKTEHYVLIGAGVIAVAAIGYLVYKNEMNSEAALAAAQQAEENTSTTSNNESYTLPSISLPSATTSTYSTEPDTSLSDGSMASALDPNLAAIAAAFWGTPNTPSSGTSDVASPLIPIIQSTVSPASLNTVTNTVNPAINTLSVGPNGTSTVIMGASDQTGSPASGTYQNQTSNNVSVPFVGTVQPINPTQVQN